MDDRQFLYDIHEKLGGMSATLESVAAMVTKQENRSDAQAAAIATITARTATLEQSLAAAMPFIEKAKQWEQRGIGMIATVSAVGAIFGGVIIGLREKLLHALGIT